MPSPPRPNLRRLELPPHRLQRFRGTRQQQAHRRLAGLPLPRGNAASAEAREADGREGAGEAGARGGLAVERVWEGVSPGGYR